MRAHSGHVLPYFPELFFVLNCQTVTEASENIDRIESKDAVKTDLRNGKELQLRLPNGGVIVTAVLILQRRSVRSFAPACLNRRQIMGNMNAYISNS